MLLNKMKFRFGEVFEINPPILKLKFRVGSEEMLKDWKSDI